jgi:putative ABC transport system permease protein
MASWLAVTLIAVGLVPGLGGSLVLTRWLAALVYQVKSDDPASFVVVSILFVLIGGAATALPAWRAAAVDPVDALRAD